MAIALSKEKVQAQHGLMMLYTFIILFLTNSLVLILAHALSPEHVVLGTYSISYWWAIYHSMFKLTVINVFVMPLVTYYEWKNGVTATPKQWMLTYLIVNFVAIWCITRFSESLGLGVTSWFVVLVLAAVFDMVQGLVMMQVGKLIKMK
jgi:hypothetical protein